MGLLFREHPKAQPEGDFKFHSFDRVFRDIHNVQDINSA